jgi:lysophospholipase L1-like esterase
VTVVNFDVADEVAAAGFDVTDGELVCRYANDFMAGDTLVTTKPFTVELVAGAGSADIYPTPIGNGLIVRVRSGRQPRGVRTRTVAVPDSPTPVNFVDLVEVVPATGLPAGVPDAIAQGFADLQVDVDGKLAAASNLADLPDAAEARTNLELGTAATSDAADFATAEQGALAGSAAPLRSVQQHIAPRVVRDVEANPATVTLSAPADAGTYNRQYIYSTAGAAWPVDSGHVVTVNAAGYEYNSNPGGMRRARFMCDRDRVQLFMAPAGAGNTFEVYIDGKRQSSTPFAFVTSAGQYVTIVVPGGVHRPRLFEVVTDAGISLVATSKPGKIWKPGPPVGPKVLVVGDSFCQPTVSANTGTGYATTRTEGIYQNIAPLLGLPDVLCQGLGGTGWLRTNGASQNYRTRIPALLTTFAPDVLVVHGGGLNDLVNGFTVDQVRDQVIAAMTEFREARPGMKLVFVEGIAPPGATPGTINPQYVSISSQARAALTSVGVYWIDVATTSPWINGAGNVNAVNADGENANVYVGGDNIHPTAAGHIYIRERVAIALRRILADDGTLVNTLI